MTTLSRYPTLRQARRPLARTVATGVLIGLLAMSGASAQQADEGSAAPAAPSGGAMLQGLDKVTARISTFPAPTDAVVRFGTLSIRVRACHKKPPTETPESSAFLEITDLRPGGEPELLFSGWMFASSPALSALEHPVYDVWVVDCINSESSSSESSG